MTLARQLAAHCTTLRLDDVPDPLVVEVKRLLLDYLGVSLAGSATPTGQVAAALAARLGGPPDATVIGSAQRTAAPNAAFANAIASHSIEMDDVDDEALLHFSPPVVSAALATAQTVGASGTDLVLAIVAGCEVMNRLSRALNPGLRNRGFHTTPTCGTFGAAVSAGLLLGLSEEQLTSALGLAGAQASGLMEMYGPSMQKRLNPGPAARNGVVAALLADLGFTGADTIIEGERGFAAAFGDGFDHDLLVRDLGTDFPVLIEYKPYAAARPIHNAIDCALAIRDAHGIGLADVESIVVHRHPEWAGYHTNPAPTTYHEAQVSLPYSVAVAIEYGTAWPHQYEDERLDPATARMELSQRVRIQEDADLARSVSCRMVLTATDGRVLVSTVDHALGSIQRPLSDQQLIDKLRALNGHVMASSDIDELAGAILGIEQLDDVNALLDRLPTIAAAG